MGWRAVHGSDCRWQQSWTARAGQVWDFGCQSQYSSPKGCRCKLSSKRRVGLLGPIPWVRCWTQPSLAARSRESLQQIDSLGSDPAPGSAPHADKQKCPVCGGTGLKPCGQCDGTGVNQDDVFGGRSKKGDTCWLCDGKAKTMCGNCIDLTDPF